MNWLLLRPRSERCYKIHDLVIKKGHELYSWPFYLMEIVDPN